MDKNRKIMIGAGGGILLLCAICICVAGIAGYVYQEELLALLGVSAPQTTAKLLPENTQFYVSTNPNIQNMAGYQNIKELYLDNPEIQALLDDFEAEVSKETDITYEADIKPWLGGEVTLAVPDFSEAIANQSDDPSILFIAKTTNKEASDNFIGKVLAQEAKDGDAFTDEVYQDIALHLQTNQFNNETTVLTTFDDFVVASNSDTLVKGMIDRSQGLNKQPALADNERFKKITDELPGNAVVSLYMEISGLFDAILDESGIDLPPEQTQDLEALDAVGMAGTLQSDGIQIETVITYNIEKMSERMKASLQQPASPNAILNDIPADAVLFYNINNFSNIWQQAKAGLDSNPDFKQSMEDFEQEVGLSIDKDVFGWMTGEFVLVLLEVTPTDEFAPPLGGYALIGTDDVDNARSHVEKVTTVFQEQMPLPLETKTIGGAEMNLITDFFSGEVQGGFGFYKNYFLMAYLEESINAATSAGQDLIANSSNFKAVQSHLPDPNYGHMYVDLDLGRKLVEGQLSDFEREDYEKNVRPFLKPIHSVGLAASADGVDKGLTKAVFFMLMTK